eukprot:CAMPEP_0181379266 /NCGR_PEP_ID=MMETSP1106-20121128/18905_1 /TAXON_ID=81844 /ORGANISM="Mantoniella antarctica, Strain SL-175" /LENGTH=73 /DNA_ID=CAMNT_0023498189 /DNA_START=203 /DNA_END=424 /DNA_ORIENTATION=-
MPTFSVRHVRSPPLSDASTTMVQVRSTADAPVVAGSETRTVAIPPAASTAPLRLHRPDRCRLEKQSLEVVVRL